MAQINVTNLTFGYDGSFDYIFENVSFSVDTDWKLGFIKDRHHMKSPGFEPGLTAVSIRTCGQTTPEVP